MNLVSDVFLQPRNETDIDLLEAVTNILVDLGHPTPRAWLENDYPREAIGKNPAFQRFLINRHWRISLGLCSTENTTRERYCLFEDGSDADYLKVFRDVIAPTLVRLKLN